MYEFEEIYPVHCSVSVVVTLYTITSNYTSAVHKEGLTITGGVLKFGFAVLVLHDCNFSQLCPGHSKLMMNYLYKLMHGFVSNEP